ncbi:MULTISPECIES: helix-turn-helix domain-containing protein [Rosenbergiella]|uniref:helix-turn-helix domain-containing protein n=1 Tax=Rosenbergiella TaxID=1356488 RepID=UPI001F4F88B9|nr:MULTISPECIES: helix-turn-helix transcriptional regulator [Rosenbergiella]
MKIDVKLVEGFDKTYLPLTFRAFWNEDGQCYLRTRVYEGKIIFFCAQLMNYYSTSITNGLESVRHSAFSYLVKDRGAIFTRQKGFFDKFRSANRIDKAFENEVISYIEQNSVWIEYYPPEFASWLPCNYSLVSFDTDGTPHWQHRPLALLQQDYPGLDFTIDIEKLTSWDRPLSISEIKELIKAKNWTMGNIAKRWGITPRHISRVFNDISREKHWDDAVRGLPAYNGDEDK